MASLRILVGTPLNYSKRVVKDFLDVFSRIQRIVDALPEGVRFVRHIGLSGNNQIPRYFEALFMATHALVVEEDLELTDAPLAAEQLKGINLVIKMPGGGGEWTSREKVEVINGIRSRIEHAFKETRSDGVGDSVRVRYTDIEIRGMLSNRLVEDESYDVKQGLIRLDPGSSPKISKEAIKRYVKTATAISNSNPRSGGFIVLGVADSDKAAKTIWETVNPDYMPVKYQTLNLTGIDWELAELSLDIDGYWAQVTRTINGMSEVSQAYRKSLIKASSPVRFEGVTLVVIAAPPIAEAEAYGDDFYERSGETTEAVKAPRMKSFLAGFPG